jgi:Domain of unknown function (DUF4382)
MRKTSGTFAAAALALVLAACGGETGRVSVMLKDAPADLSAAVVTISEIDLVGSGGTTVLSTAKTTTDLLTLANDTAKLVDGAEVPVGTYTQLRFVISGAYVSSGGALYATSPTYEGLPAGAVVAGALTTPSFAQSGLKIDLPGGAVQVGTVAKVLLVDFDVSQSFGHDAGGSGAWVMHPVAKATELELSGTVDVTLKLASGVSLPSGASLAGFQAVLAPAAGGDGVTVPFTANAAGSYDASFKYLFPGSYTVTLSGPAGVTFATSPATPMTVEVVSGQATPAAFSVTAASAQ